MRPLTENSFRVFVLSYSLHVVESNVLLTKLPSESHNTRIDQFIKKIKELECVSRDLVAKPKENLFP